MKNVIAVCATRIDDEFCRNFLTLLREKVPQDEYTIAVFHSVYDFSDPGVALGARNIFRMLPYDELCTVIILHDSLFDKTLIDMIVSDSEKNNVPVIMARGIDDRCYSLTADFETAYEELLDSVIGKQGIKNTFYIAGRKNDDPDSEHRLAVYKKVLRKNGCEFDEEDVDYGCYWETPTLEVMDRLFKRRKALPEAILCANDITAFTVMDVLSEKGIRVPDDIVVTGFDGLDSSKYFSPSLSSCCEDTLSLVEKAVATVKSLTAGEDVPKVQYYTYKTAIRQSSEKGKQIASSEFDTQLFYRMRADEINERVYNDWLDTVIAEPGMENLKKNMPYITDEHYSVSVRADAYLDSNADTKADFPSEYFVMRKDRYDGVVQKFVSASQIIYRYLKHIPKSHMGLFSMISNRDFVYGLAFSSTAYIDSDAQKINRFIRTLDRALYISLCGDKRCKKIGEHYQKKYTDALTGMLNIDGANKWYTDAVTNDFTRNNHLSVGVYTFINYQQVLDTYGVHVLEENMLYIAKSLKLANPEYAVIARISVDSFAVMLLSNSSEIFSPIVDNAVNLFYGSLDVKSKSNNKNSDIEISCGYADSDTPWQSQLSDHLNAAITNLYRNRVSFEKFLPENIDISDSTKLLEYRATFMTLIESNLFTYHFQPIVDAKSGEIVAYEALMRTTGDIKMSPLDVLNAAALFSKLEQIEYLSFMNIFSAVSEKAEEFEDRRIFINTIPGHFLEKNLCEDICNKYGDLLSRSVIEITESETVTEEELNAIRTFGGFKDKINIAVDDYGTGHSNVVNLLEYKPQIVKIDRYLVTNINEDKNKQMLVKSLIEFSKENNIKMLAEGVETGEELDTVIDLGVDFIQGYYTARPAPEVLKELPADIKNRIVERAALKNK